MSHHLTGLTYHNPNGLFDVGEIYSDESALAIIKKSPFTLEQLLDRHVSGDFGEIVKLNLDENETSIRTGQGIVASSYNLPSHDCIVVYTILEPVGATFLTALEDFAV